MVGVMNAINSLSEKVTLPNITDWIMIAITIVYVYATIKIYQANNRSADAAREQIKESQKQLVELQKQLAESRKQFEESQRQFEESQKQFAESQKQHAQNVGIQLYNIRKEFFRKFREKKYDEVFWDASLLFSEETSDQVIGTGSAYGEYQHAQSKLKLYEDRMKQDDPELYQKYCLCHDEDKLLELCEGYTAIVADEIYGTSEALVYSEIIEKLEKRKHEYDSIQSQAFYSIRDEIKESIQYGRREDIKE